MESCHCSPIASPPRHMQASSRRTQGGDTTSDHLTHKSHCQEPNCQRLVHRCELCEFIAFSEDKLTAHRECKHKVFRCRFCKSEFATIFAQRKHLVTCAKLLALRKAVRAQVDEIQDARSTHVSIRCMLQPVRCPLCRKTFASMFQLGDRAQQHLCCAYATRLFGCTGCSLQFTTAHALKGHLISKYTQKDARCVDSGTICFENMTPKFPRRATPVAVRASALVPLKSQPTDEDEMHDARTQQALVMAHLLTVHDSSLTAEYYRAMRTMMLKVDCPFCGAQCCTLSGLHAHCLTHHTPRNRCLYQCAGCHVTYKTPSGLGQHIKKEYDLGSAACYDRVNVVRKQDYAGPVTGWNMKNKGPAGPVLLRWGGGGGPIVHTIDVKPDPHFDLHSSDVKPDVDAGGVKKEEEEDLYSTSASYYPGLYRIDPAPNGAIPEYEAEFEPRVSRCHVDPNAASSESHNECGPRESGEIKEELVDEIKLELF